MGLEIAGGILLAYVVIEWVRARAKQDAELRARNERWERESAALRAEQKAEERELQEMKDKQRLACEAYDRDLQIRARSLWEQMDEETRDYYENEAGGFEGYVKDRRVRDREDARVWADIEAGRR